MPKSTLLALVTLLIMSSTAFADKDDKHPKCKPEKVPGSYVRLDTNVGYMDQLKLNSDGTAYFFRNSSFQNLVTGGAFIPQIGSWKCLDDGGLLITTIGTYYLPTTVGGTPDIQITANRRITEKLTVVDDDTLVRATRVVTSIPLLNDPFGRGTLEALCQPSGIPCPPYPYKRVKPQTSDLP